MSTKEEQQTEKGRSRKRPTQETAKKQPEKSGTDKKENTAFKKTIEEMRKEVEAEEKEKKKGRMKAAAGVLAVAAAGCCAWYLTQANQYKTVYFPNTAVNGIDVSMKTPEEVMRSLGAAAEDYVLTIQERDGKTETISAGEIGFHTVFDGSLEKILAEQNTLTWIFQKGKEKQHQVNTLTAYDEELAEKAVKGLAAMDPASQYPAKDAKLSDYIPGTGYTVLPEENGTQLEEELVQKAVKEALDGVSDSVDLEEHHVYLTAKIKQDDPALHEEAEKRNVYASRTITFDLGDNEEILNGDRIHEWMVLAEDGSWTIDQAQVDAYVEEFAEKYETSGKPKILKTSYGPEVEITQGFYGWKMDKAAEKEYLYNQLLTGEDGVRQPIFTQTAASHKENDYGDTYVEINLTAQHLFFYVEGKLLIESDFVSGNPGKGNATPEGAYPVTYKQKNATLRGRGYATPVSYWMPFNRNVGMHDANWRDAYGGTLYKSNGSHGCINLPPAVAKIVFEYVEKGMPVLCYKLEGTESAKSTAKKSYSGIQPFPETISTAPVTENPEAKPEETKPAETKPAAKPAAKPAPAPTQPAPAPAPVPTQPAPTEPAPTQPVTQPDYSGGPGMQPTQPAPTQTIIDYSGGPGVVNAPQQTRPQAVEGPSGGPAGPGAGPGANSGNTQAGPGGPVTVNSQPG